MLPSNIDVMKLIMKHGKEPPDYKISYDTMKYRVMKVLFGHHNDFEMWLQNPQKNRYMQQKVGDFMQDIFGKIGDNINLGVGDHSGVDILTNGNVYIELKIDSQTMNHDSRNGINIKLNRIRKSGHDAYCVHMFRKQKKEPSGKFDELHMSGEKYINELLSRDIGGIDGLISHIEKIVN